MTIQEVIDLAKNSELRNLNAGTDDAILGYVNLALIELYKRFALKVEEEVIALQDEQEIYTMPSDFMWLVAAYGEVPEDNKTDLVNILPINEEDNPLSINMVSWNQVQIPLSVAGSYVSVIYRAKPSYLSNTDLNTEIQLPVQMLEPLLSYIGYKAHASIDASLQEENNSYYQRFEIQCERIQSEGMFTSDDLSMSDRLKSRGFV